MIDFFLCVLGGVIVLYLFGSFRKHQPKPGFFILLGMVFSALVGYGWVLLSAFVFPVLAGANLFSGGTEPLSFWAEVSLWQAVPSGIGITLLGTWMSCRHCLRVRSKESLEKVDD